MTSIQELLSALFGQTEGAVTVIDADGSFFTDTDLAKVAFEAGQMEDPWVDLVTDQGEAVGLFVAGNPDSVTPQPSFDVQGGMVYMIDGPPADGVKTNFHLCPLSVFKHKGKYDLDGLNFYAPDELDLVTAASEREIVLMMGRRRDEGQGRWKEKKSSFGQFTDFLRDHQEGGKDGSCYLQGQSANGHRKSAAQIANHILGVDLDSGAPLEDVMKTIQKHGLEAVIYTTHSHLKDTSVIKRDHFMKWANATTAEPDAIRDYLIQSKGVLPEIVDDLEILDDAHHTEEGIVILVRHKPMPKFRAVFALDKPFIFAKRGGSQQDAILEWKERYAGFCSDMGFFFDEKCVDPARLFYFPRHPKGDTSFGSWLIVGDPLNLDKFDRVKMKRGRDGKRTAVTNNAFTGAGVDDGDDDKERYVTESGFNLRGWAAKHAKRFEVQTMLEDVVGGDFIREPRQSGKMGTHVECPFEADHTSFGGGGTYVVNASDNMEDGFDGGFTFHCVHNACAGRDRLDYLKEMIDQELITPDDLKNKDYLLELEGDEDDGDARPEPARASARLQQGDTPTRSRDGSDSAGAEEDSGRSDEVEFGEDEESMLRAFNRRYAVIRTSGGVKILVEPRTVEDDVVFESQNDVSLYEKNKVIWIKDGKQSKKLEAFKCWLEWEDRRTYTKVLFAPGRDLGRDTYNLFRGWQYVPVKTTWLEEDMLADMNSPVPGDWSMLRGHIYENMCESDERLFQWFMTWLSMIFQQPASKPGSTVVITGEKGVGKSTLFDYVNQLLGRHGITVSQRKQIVGQFNGHLATTLLMVCEEAFWAADPQAEGVLKDMITNKSLLIEKKGYDPIQSQNYTRLALISNSDWVVPASLKDERRFFVLRCNSTRMGDLKFFEDMRLQMEKLGGLEAMLYDLLHWEPIDGTWSSLYKPPLTSHLQHQQMETLSGVQKFMLELVKSGSYETNDDKVTPIELNMDTETLIYAVDMRAAVHDYVKFRFASDKAKTGFDEISAIVCDWFGAREVSLQTEGSTNKKRTFIFPPLADVRAQFKERKGLDIEVMAIEEVRSAKAMRTR